MKWPFALRSSVDTLKRRCDELDKSAREWASDQQATFFNVLGRLTHEWEHARCMQFGHIQPDLDDEGRWLLVELAQYAERS